ncbi:MAG TPA: sulfite exporter TauE/SafE family protein [Desulfosporosinus sp.]|nr:sulfite exporter TauE/SafE family protein [Desulfosporosinus sp.]
MNYISGVELVWIYSICFICPHYNGFLMLVIPIMADVYGGKESTGIILPMLLVGDVFAVWYYNRHTKWSNIRKLLPWTAVGLALGLTIGNFINDAQFKTLIGSIILVCLLILVYIEKKGDSLKVPKKLWLYALIGIMVGFSSMIGNAAGAIFTIYLLAMDFNKNDFLGTTAWFFLLLNLTKVPLQIFVWHNISVPGILLACGMIPVIAIGALLGVVIIKKFNDKFFRYLVMAITAMAAIRLFI